MRHLLCQYPNHEIYINGFDEIIALDELDGEHLVCSGAKYQIEQHFNDYELTEISGDGDPQKERDVKVSGYTYVKYHFNGDYDKALECIVDGY